MRHIFNDIISVENLLKAWREFLCGKRRHKDIAEFSLHLSDNILTLHHELAEQTYQHGPYHAFKINDPKPRDIHKASVRDRLVHHAVYRILYPYFNRKFIFDSYSCRHNKGTHRAANRFREYGRKVSRNNTRTAWILRGDIRKFFASIDHKILKDILRRQIEDNSALRLLGQIIDSFETKNIPNIGLPLGNLTSQLLVNIYMNEFDQFIKRKLKVIFYIRYADDFVILSETKSYLVKIIPEISKFLEIKLKLLLHPDKLFIKTFVSGVDFLGWIQSPHHRVLRTSTKQRMFKRLGQNPKKESLISYQGLLSHGNTHELTQKILKQCEVEK